MPSTKCSVLGCTSKEKKHVFPNTDGDYKIWLECCNNEKLFKMDKSLVRKRYAVCHIHFDKSCESPGTSKLKKGSLPTLNLSKSNNTIKSPSVLVYMCCIDIRTLMSVFCIICISVMCLIC